MSASEVFVREMACTLGIDGLDALATHTRVEPDRQGTDMIVGYQLGAATVVRGGPEHADLLAGLANPDANTSFDALRSWAEGIGWREFDGGLIHVIDPGSLAPAAAPAGHTVVKLRGRAGEPDEALVQGFLATQSVDDLDEADFEPDSLDERLFGVVDDAGALLALAGALPWDQTSSFEDIGILVSPAQRRRGIGRAVVRAIAVDIADAGSFALYRCNWSNETSRRLAIGLGFEQVSTLIAFRPAHHEVDP